MSYNMKKNLGWHHGFCAVDQVYLHDVTMKWCWCCFILWNHVVNGDDVTNIWCHCCVVFLSLGCCKHKLCAKLWIVITLTAKGWAVVRGMVWFLCPSQDTDQIWESLRSISATRVHKKLCIQRTMYWLRAFFNVVKDVNFHVQQVEKWMREAAMDYECCLLSVREAVL